MQELARQRIADDAEALADRERREARQERIRQGLDELLAKMNARVSEED